MNHYYQQGCRLKINNQMKQQQHGSDQGKYINNSNKNVNNTSAKRFDNNQESSKFKWVATGSSSKAGETTKQGPQESRHVLISGTAAKTYNRNTFPISSSTRLTILNQHPTSSTPVIKTNFKTTYLSSKSQALKKKVENTTDTIRPEKTVVTANNLVGLQQKISQLRNAFHDSGQQARVVRIVSREGSPKGVKFDPSAVKVQKIGCSRKGTVLLSNKLKRLKSRKVSQMKRSSSSTKTVLLSEKLNHLERNKRSVNLTKSQFPTTDNPVSRSPLQHLKSRTTTSYTTSYNNGGVTSFRRRFSSPSTSSQMERRSSSSVNRNILLINDTHHIVRRSTTVNRKLNRFTKIRFLVNSHRMKIDLRNQATKSPMSSTMKVASQVLKRSLAVKYMSAISRATTKTKYCIFFNRFGRCTRGDECKFKHDPDKIAVCNRFLRGSCRKSDCPFSHCINQDKMPTCLFFLRGVCANDKCPYSHVAVKRTAEPCQDFINGYCPLAKKCKKLHTIECRTFLRTGKCVKSNCKLKHRKKSNSLQSTRVDDNRMNKVHLEKKEQSMNERKEQKRAHINPSILPSFISFIPSQDEKHDIISKHDKYSIIDSPEIDQDVISVCCNTPTLRNNSGINRKSRNDSFIAI